MKMLFVISMKMYTFAHWTPNRIVQGQGTHLQSLLVLKPGMSLGILLSIKANCVNGSSMTQITPRKLPVCSLALFPNFAKNI